MHCRLWASFSCFLLVTALSRRHLALAALPPPVVRSSEEPSAAYYSVVWSSPASGDRFGPGDTIVGEWQVTPPGQKVVSPSFRLCVGGEDGCGATVWPEVVEESEGSYYVSLTAPSVATESGYYLQMKDDFGRAYSSPIFNVTPTPQKKNKPAAHPPDVAQPRPDQAPMSSSTGTKSKGATDSNPAPVPAPANPNGILSPPSAASSISPNSAASASTPTGSSGGGGNGGPQVAAAHNAPPTAALAVPLSLAGAIILLAGGLALHHRRRLAAEKERSWSLSRGNHHRRHHHDDDDDVEKVLFARALFRGAAAAALPPYHAHDAYYDDCLREKADPLYSSSSYAPSYAYRAPEPRQRTRELDLFPQREFTTTSATSARPRAHHPSPSPSPSSYRGLWARRHSVLRRGTSTSNGGGSLWRSLSFAAAAAAAARHKKVAPVAPPSALNSPAMTAVTSVTSEVLPSYLPSPNFVGAADDQARGGDFGFENIPLSPPLPSPLHTRGEAADPDDSRMRELRGVYEAVSRALGNMHGV